MRRPARFGRVSSRRQEEGRTCLLTVRTWNSQDVKSSRERVSAHVFGYVPFQDAGKGHVIVFQELREACIVVLLSLEEHREEGREEKDHAS
jgi:hypothetical protein